MMAKKNNDKAGTQFIKYSRVFDLLFSLSNNTRQGSFLFRARSVSIAERCVYLCAVYFTR